MKTRIIISILALLFIAGDFVDGCDEESPEPDADYINVFVTVKGYYQVIPNLDVPLSLAECKEITKNFQVLIEVYKDGALKFTDVQY